MLSSPCPRRTGAGWEAFYSSLLQDKNYCAIVPPRCSSISNKRAAGPLLFRRRYTDARRHRDGYATPPRQIRDASPPHPRRLRICTPRDPAHGRNKHTIKGHAFPSGGLSRPCPQVQGQVRKRLDAPGEQATLPSFPKRGAGGAAPAGGTACPPVSKNVGGWSGRDSGAGQARPLAEEGRRPKQDHLSPS